jgi:tRNA A37 methylthiotransferase MiaB
MSNQARRILLIEPPFQRLFKETYSLDRFPLGLAYLAGAIRMGTPWEVQVYNADFAGPCEPIEVRYWASEGFENYLRALRDPSAAIWQEVAAVVGDFQPTVVGITAKTQNFASACRVAELVKRIDPDVRVIVGGPHASMVGRDVLQNPSIDVCVRGEGERTIVELLSALDREADLGAVAGVVFRRGREVVVNPPRPLMDDLDGLPFPQDVAPGVLRDYPQYPRSAFRNIFATRGCPYQCLYCGSRNIWGRAVRYRSPDNVAAEIRGLRAGGLRFVNFDDDIFAVRRDYTEALCRAIRTQCPGVAWSCETHVKLIDRSTVETMKAGGCYKINLGIESGNNDILRAIRKNITIESALAACREIKRSGLELVTFFMVGFPQETEQTLADTRTAMEAVRCDTVVYSIFTPYPNTEAHELCRQMGLIGEDFDPTLYNHQSPANCFCAAIPPQRFRELLSQIERQVDRRNRRNRLKRIFSRTTLRRARELGWRQSFWKIRRVLLGM